MHSKHVTGLIAFISFRIDARAGYLADNNNNNNNEEKYDDDNDNDSGFY